MWKKSNLFVWYSKVQRFLYWHNSNVNLTYSKGFFLMGKVVSFSFYLRPCLPCNLTCHYYFACYDKKNYFLNPFLVCNCHSLSLKMLLFFFLWGQEDNFDAFLIFYLLSCSSCCQTSNIKCIISSPLEAWWTWQSNTLATYHFLGLCLYVEVETVETVASLSTIDGIEREIGFALQTANLDVIWYSYCLMQYSG